MPDARQLPGTDQETVEGRVVYIAQRESERGIRCCAVNLVYLKDLRSARDTTASCRAFYNI